MTPTTPYWPFGKHEPELLSLYQWIDAGASSTQTGREWGIWGGITGSLFGCAGGAIGVLVGSLGFDPSLQQPWPVAGPLLAATLGSAFAGWMIVRRQSPGQRAARRTLADARNFTWQLINARWHGDVKGFIGEDRALVLNEGAAAFNQARQALSCSAWKAVAPDTDYAATRERTLVAIEVAMARLVLLIGQGISTEAAEIQRLLRDMRETADECSHTAEQLSTSAGQPGDASENLRQVLSEMRLLNASHDEYDRIRNRSN